MGCQCLQVKTLASGELLTAASHECQDENTAKQQASLSLIQHLQHTILGFITASQLKPASVTRSNEQQQTAEMTVSHEGDHENSTPEIGQVVKVQYELILDTEDGPAPGASTHQGQVVPLQHSHGTALQGPARPSQDMAESASGSTLLDQSDTFRFEYGGGGVLPEIQMAGLSQAFCEVRQIAMVQT